MNTAAKLFNYCERGLDPALLAEPLNVASNLAFFAAGGVALVRLRRHSRRAAVSRETRRLRLAVSALALLTMAVGIGSILLHVFATRLAQLADVLPIAAFMVGYLVLALRVFLGMGWPAIAAVGALFLVASYLGSTATCPDAAPAGEQSAACLNGSLGYLPALATLIAVGLLASRRSVGGTRHAAEAATATKILAAAFVFAVSLSLRTIDIGYCDSTEVFGRVRGTHALWHVLNGVTLHLLLTAAISRLEGGTKTA